MELKNTTAQTGSESYHSCCHEKVPWQQRPQAQHEEDEPDTIIPAGGGGQTAISQLLLGSITIDLDRDTVKCCIQSFVSLVFRCTCGHGPEKT